MFTDLEDMGVAVGEVAMGELPVYANTQAMGMKLMTSSERKANKKKPKKTKKEEETEKVQLHIGEYISMG